MSKEDAHIGTCALIKPQLHGAIKGRIPPFLVQKIGEALENNSSLRTLFKLSFVRVNFFSRNTFLGTNHLLVVQMGLLLSGLLGRVPEVILDFEKRWRHMLKEPL